MTDGPIASKAIGDRIMQSDDLAAMNIYMSDAKPVSPQAIKLRDEWLTWWESLGWYAKTFDSNTFDQARNRKHAFDIANVKSSAEAAAVKEQIKTSFTTEEARGEPNRMRSDGTYTEKPPEKEPFFPTRIKILAGAILAGVTALIIAKKVYIDPFIPR
jgi:hypothetical protein